MLEQAAGGGSPLCPLVVVRPWQGHFSVLFWGVETMTVSASQGCSDVLRVTVIDARRPGTV